MKYFLFFLSFLFITSSIFFLSFSTVSFADDAQMKSTLVRIINQLQSIKPLINQAKQEQPHNPRIKIHFDTWIDNQGQKHDGLRQDIEQIQKALITAVNRETIEPRNFTPIAGDFIGDKNRV